MSKRKLLIYGHVELNPSPFTFKKTNVCRASPLSILEARLHQFGLKHQDVGGAGGNFFLEQSHISYMGIQTVTVLFVPLGYSS